MKKIRIKVVIALILSLSTSTGLLCAELLKIEQLQEKNIERDARKIGQLLFKHHMVKIGLTAISSIVHLVELYRCCQFLYDKCSSSPGIECCAYHQSVVYRSSEQKIGKINPLVRGVVRVAVSIKNLLISKELCYALLLGSSAITTQRLMADVNHPHTMTWFTYKKVPYKRMFDQTRKYAQLLDGSTLDKEKNIYYEQTLNRLCNQIVRRVEQLCGFMLCKSSQLTEVEQKEAQSIIRYLSYSTNAWGRAVSKLFNQEFFDSQQFIKRVTDFQEELQRELSHFARVERETPIDVLQVISMHKQL